MAGLVRGLDADTAAVVTQRLAESTAYAKQAWDAHRAALCDDIRATKDVRRVLRHSPAWPDQWGLDEAYANPGTGYADWVKFGLPDCNGIIVDSRCPSLTAIVARSEPWGSLPGHSNSLLLVADADWDALVAETAALAQEDGARKAKLADEDAERTAALRAVTVPPAAISAFRRYGGDPEAAWEREDECAAAMIWQYGAAIAVQRLGVRKVSFDTPVEPRDW